MGASADNPELRAAAPAGEPLSRRARYGALALAAVWAFLVGWLWTGAPALARGIGLAWALLGAWRPDFYFYSLALALPWFGDQNGSAHAPYLLEFGLLGMLVRHQLRRAVGLLPRRRQTIDAWLLLLLYYSLWSGIVNWHWIYTEWYLNRADFLYINFNHFGTSETFPFQATVRLGISVGLYFALRDDPWGGRQRRIFTGCALGALIFASTLGLFDYFGIFSLEWWRPPNEDITRFGYPRLQSLFGHSGWFAEYLAFIAPFALAVGLAGKSGIWRKMAWVSAVFFVPVQLLTMQRGEWFALAAGYGTVMVAFAAVRRERRIWMRGVILPTLFFLACAFILYGVSPEFRNRFSEISVLSDRTKIWASAWELLGPQWLSGVGYGNYYNYHRFVFPEGHPYFALDKVHAHNLYLHILVERGIIGMSIFLIIIFLALRSAARAVKCKEPGFAFRLGLLGAFAAFLVDGLVQYFPYIRILEIILFMFLGMTAWGGGDASRPGKMPGRAVFWILLFGIPAYFVYYSWDDLKSVQAWVIDRHFKIEGEQAVLDVPPEGTRFRLELASIHSALNVWPVEMTISFDGRELTRVPFGRIEHKAIEIELPPRRESWQKLTVRASRVYSPLRDAGWRNPPVPKIGVLYLPLEPID